MNVILCGSTGFVGGEILNELISNEKINKITCLVRKEIDWVKSDKINTIILKDFSKFDNELLKELVNNNQACIWTIGGRRSQFQSDEEYENVSINYTITFCNGLINNLNDDNDNDDQERQRQPFTFIYCSGMGANEFANKSLLQIEVKTRIVKGKVERLLTEIQIENKNKLNLIIHRPGGITSPNSVNSFFQWMLSSFAIDLSILSKFIVKKLIDSNSNNNNNNTSTTTIYYNKDIYNNN